MRKLIFIGIMAFALLGASNSAFTHEDPEYNEALKYYNSKNYQKAAELFKEYVKKTPDAAAYYRIGYALYELKKFDEAAEYFKEAYLIDPSFSPEAIGLSKEQVEKRAKKPVKPSEEAVTTEQKAPAPEAKAVQPETKKEPAPVKQPEQPKAAAAPMPQPQKIEPQKIQPSAPMPQLPKFKKETPGISPEMLTAMAAGFGLIILAIVAVWVIYYLLCLFLIAKKVAIPAPWTAWIPIVNLWTIVTCAGKPWWWIILLLIPLVNIFIYVYLWMCISENRGKSKWLGLLLLVPPADLVLYGILAFSKDGTQSSTEDTITS